MPPSKLPPLNSRAENYPNAHADAADVVERMNEAVQREAGLTHLNFSDEREERDRSGAFPSLALAIFWRCDLVTTPRFISASTPKSFTDTSINTTSTAAAFYRIQME